MIRGSLLLQEDTLKERTRFCWASLFAEGLYNKELAVANPKPTGFDDEHVFPRDMWIATYKESDPPTFDELLNFALQGCDIMIEGTHNDQVTTYVMWSFATPIVLDQERTSIVSFPTVEKEEEVDYILSTLYAAYYRTKMME